MFRRGAGILSIVALVSGAVFPSVSYAAKNIQGSPKVINLFLNWQMRDEDLSSLARWDVVVLDADQQARYPEKIRMLRSLNPAIKILAYLPAEEIAQARFSEPSDFPFAKLASRIQDAWYIKDPSGQQAYFWPGSSLLNVTDLGPMGSSGQRWNTFFPQFIHDEVLSTGLWDGIFFDNTFDRISSYAKGAIDLDRNGLADSSATDDPAWRTGMTKMLRRMKELDPNAILMGNGNGYYADVLHGSFFEHFPSWSWGPNWKEYRDAITRNRAPSYTALNVNTDNQDRQDDFRLMRYGLASAMIGGGYYSFDKGDWNHDVIWWYDEYETPMGAPISAPRILAGATAGAGSVPAVWSRRFGQGMVLVNSTDKAQHIALGGSYEKVRGVQDTRVNDGSIVNVVDLQPKDGLFLIRKSEPTEIRVSSFINGSFVRIYGADGKQQQNGFFAQRDDAPNGATVLATDIERPGSDDLVIAEKGKVTIRFGSGKPSITIVPFGSAYKGRVFVSAGNTNMDSAKELIVGREGVPPEVRVYDMNGMLRAKWFAYNAGFGGGVHTAIGDLDGDGRREIVTGAGPGGGPHIRIWKTDGSVWAGGYFAFDPSETGGVSVAVGDVDADSKEEVIVGSGQGAIPRVRIFDYRGILLKEIRLGTSPLPGGLTVTATDINGDGKKEIIVGGLSAF